MTDIDYAVHPDDVDTVAAVLEECGFARDEPPGMSGEFTRRFAREYHFTREAGGVPVAVEVHEALVPTLALRQAFPLDAQRLAESAVQDAHGAAPRAEHALLFCIIHFAVVHRFSRLIWLEDIARLCAAPGLDWDFFEGQARGVHAGAAVHAVLCAAQRLLGADAPVDRFARDRRLPMDLIERRAPLWLSGAAPAAEIAALPFALCERPARTLARFLFPPRDFIALRYGVPRPLAPAWAAARPAMLALNALLSSKSKNKLP